MKNTGRARRQRPEQHEVIIETPRGSRNKYKQDEQSGRIRFSKVLPEGMMFPYDFGFIPDPKADDGDPSDVLVLCDEPMFPSCQVQCRIVGVLKANQRAINRHKPQFCLPQLFAMPTKKRDRKGRTAQSNPARILASSPLGVHRPPRQCLLTCRRTRMVGVMRA